MAASYRSQARRGKKGIQEQKKPAIPRNDNISSLGDGTARDWIRCFISKVMALWVGIIFSPKQVT